MRDAATGTPALRETEFGPGDLAEGSRGLAIVAVLAEKWGVIERVVGKTVWCEIA